MKALLGPQRESLATAAAREPTNFLPGSQTSCSSSLSATKNFVASLAKNEKLAEKSEDIRQTSRLGSVSR